MSVDNGTVDLDDLSQSKSRAVSGSLSSTDFQQMTESARHLYGAKQFMLDQQDEIERQEELQAMREMGFLSIDEPLFNGNNSNSKSKNNNNEYQSSLSLPQQQQQQQQQQQLNLQAQTLFQLQTELAQLTQQLQQLQTEKQQLNLLFLQQKGAIEKEANEKVCQLQESFGMGANVTSEEKQKQKSAVLKVCKMFQTHIHVVLI